MAKVLFSFCSYMVVNGKFEIACMPGSIIESLSEAGNDVLAINTAEFLPTPWNGMNDFDSTLDAEKFVQAVRDFDPELILCFNHSIPDNVLDLFSADVPGGKGDVPIVLWDADSIQFFNDRERLLRTPERYHCFCFSHSGLENVKAFGMLPNQVFYMQAATAVRAEALEQDKAVSFIGTMFRNDDRLWKLITNYPDRNKLRSLIELVRGGYDNIHHPDIVAEKEAIEAYIPMGNFFSIFAAQRRIDVLNALTEEGLEIYGFSDWPTAGMFFPMLPMAYNPELVYTLKHNQDIYNKSKVCLNISHTQVVDGFAWRVMDIMASQGCLLTDVAKGVNEFAKGYVTIPSYGSAGEARDLVRRLVADEAWRKDIVAGSQACIDAIGRWPHRFREMSQILGVNLLPQENRVGQIQILRREDYVIPVPPPPPPPPPPSPPSLLKRIWAKIGRMLGYLPAGSVLLLCQTAEDII